ncbi:septum formation initiator family protein [Geobacter sulfurreducens]|jgi:cell division protein FtsB|uniref:Septum formation initiator family protein n=1 Tax=Geobacter sulfurreducens (strain ATCC 51573 / DSM 12127 / PCA) TaxID=243231 RepID=Q74C61_GEOSL|nr:septum formation initiator family protein [Geobacter sulfurreducens]BET58224.1 septum formation initiator family protein [Geobacter sp. 60473]AAR35191.1 septum formation initiator family protein [Geobacter sulfurreducens PCA]ADI84649.1 septum formation initiator family protein [Geobacter sulfurreducens KN400]AJY71132.1 septum formation initiator [Geobacter sulfurreducens]QVW33766.1 septum formation initiator family protein [Geobacter sulfurreducens]
MRKRMYLIPTGCILFILYFTVFGERGLLRIYHLSNERDQIRQKVGVVRDENEKLKREIEALKSDRRYLESIARKDFGLVRPNEIVYQFPTATDRPEAKPQQPVSTAVGAKR